VGDVGRDLKVAVGTGTLGVDDTLGDALAVKVGELVNQVEVLQEDRAVLASGQRVLVVVNGIAVRGRQRRHL